MKPAISSYGVSDLRVVARVTCVSCDLIAFASFAVCCGALALLCLRIFVAQCCHGYPLLHLICLVSQPTFKLSSSLLMSLTVDFRLGTLKRTIIFSVMNLFSSFLCFVLYQRINSTLTCYIVFGCIS